MPKPTSEPANSHPEIAPSKRGIALNVTRTRVSVLMFNLTIISFMFSMMATSASPANTLSHLSNSVALFSGFCLTLLGLFILLYSQDLDELGLSRPWHFTLGSITTYLALSQTVTAFMHSYVLGATMDFKEVESVTRENSGPFASLSTLDSMPLLILTGMGSLIWILITYIAPLLAIRKSQIKDRSRWLFAVYYFALQITIYWVYSKVWHLEYIPEDQSVNMLGLFALQFMQPLLWFY